MLGSLLELEKVARPSLRLRRVSQGGIILLGTNLFQISMVVFSPQQYFYLHFTYEIYSLSLRLINIFLMGVISS